MEGGRNQDSCVEKYAAVLVFGVFYDKNQILKGNLLQMRLYLTIFQYLWSFSDKTNLHFTHKERSMIMSESNALRTTGKNVRNIHRLRYRSYPNREKKKIPKYKLQTLNKKVFSLYYLCLNKHLNNYPKGNVTGKYPKQLTLTFVFVYSPYGNVQPMSLNSLCNRSGFLTKHNVRDTGNYPPHLFLSLPPTHPLSSFFTVILEVPMGGQTTW